MRRSQHGLALLAMLMALVAGVLYALAERLPTLQQEARRGRQTHEALRQAKEALLGYAATARDRSADSDAKNMRVFGYLPCPDLTGDGTAAPTCDLAGRAAVGLLPYRSLGLPDLRDADGNCLWYVVSGRFKLEPAGTAYNATTNPTPQPLNWDTQGQFAIAGSAVVPETGDGGAAAMVFAPGAALTGQTRIASGTQPCRVDPATALAAHLESGGDFASAATPIALATGTRRDTNGDLLGNDSAVWISPREIFDRVVRRADFGNPRAASPPGHIDTLIDEIAAVLDKRIQDDLFAGGTPTAWTLPANPVASTPYHVGSLQPGASGGVANPDALNNDKSTGQRSSLAAAYDGYLDNWSELFRQAVCPNLDSPCLDIANAGVANCRGALLFAGRRADGLPRPSAERIASTACDARCILPKLFERGSGALDLLEGSGRYAGATAYDNANAATRAADVAACLGRGSFVSLQRHAAAFDQGTVRPTGSGNAVAAVSGVATATPAIMLGSGTAASRSGCVWYPQALPLGGSLRLYFSYRVDTAASTARGFALALADAATNAPTATDPIMCGSSGTVSLGYAGVPASGTATVGTATLAVAATSWSAGSGRATLTTTASHGFASGQTVVVAGVSPAAYNGSFPILSVSGGTRLTYALADPGLPRAGIAPPKIGLEFDLHADASRDDPSADHFAFIHWGSAADNGLVPGATAKSGDDDNAHDAGVAGDGSQPLNPRDLTVAGATPGIATVKASDPFLPYASTPLTTDIHIRLDVVRSYDATLRQARLDLRAYIGDTFALEGNCLLADFRNLARDLAALCPTRTPTVAEEGLPVADIAGPALANIYLGFTTARGSSANDHQDIKVQNLMLRSQ